MTYFKHLLFSSLAALSALTLAAEGASALPMSVSAPASYGNLSVYFIRGAGSGSGMTTVDRALASGQARIDHVKGEGFKISNFSNAALFVPFGTLLRGAIQDQVVGAGLVVPPNTGPMSLTTFCVDPFRSAARSSEPVDRLLATGELIPSQTARLAMLSGSGEQTRTIDDIRQSGVWWSLDALQVGLKRQTSHDLAPAGKVSWTVSDDAFATEQLAGRTGSWINSLPLILQDSRLGRLERPVVSALSVAGAHDGSVIGAAFAINGRWAGAEIEGTHAMFEQAWPGLLRSYAVQSLMARGEPATATPSAAAIEADLDQAQASAVTPREVGAMQVFDGPAAIVARTASGGHVLQTLVLPKLGREPSAATPAGRVVAMLESGEVEGEPLAGLAAAPVLTQDAIHIVSRPAPAAPVSFADLLPTRSSVPLTRAVTRAFDHAANLFSLLGFALMLSPLWLGAAGRTGRAVAAAATRSAQAASRSVRRGVSALGTITIVSPWAAAPEAALLAVAVVPRSRRSA